MESPEIFPSELVTTSVFALLDVASVAHIACTSRSFCQVADGKALWADLYRREWQKENALLKEPSSVLETHASHKWLYEQRLRGMLPLMVAIGVHVLEGILRDDRDGSETPVKAVLGLQKGRVGGYMCIGADSAAPQCTWVGMYAPLKTNGENNDCQWTIHWEEKSRSSRRGCSYLGDFDPNGMRLTGIYDDRDDAERSGTFELTASSSDNAPTLNELSQAILQILCADSK
mmetsp:Transcript_46699/g.108861  ORF Transcript_46699/g.108861 Transcript_46699/m.108861 type:complete len:231 (+) Transcript_46699:143-835(+)